MIVSVVTIAMLSREVVVEESVVLNSWSEKDVQTRRAPGNVGGCGAKGTLKAAVPRKPRRNSACDRALTFKNAASLILGPKEDSLGLKMFENEE